MVSIRWFLTLDYQHRPVGYDVVVETDDGDLLEHYVAGNCAMESSTYLASDHPNALDRETLVSYARTTASYFAGQYGVAVDDIVHDIDTENG